MLDLKKYLIGLYQSAEDDNIKNIITLHKKYMPSPYKWLDTGCWDGINTKKYSLNEIETHGTDIARSPNLSDESNIHFTLWDSNNGTTEYPNGFFDLIISNQVIEHLTELDNYMSEIPRILRKGGIFIVSSNNLASWHNIISLALGWMPFDLQNFSIKDASTGNPFGIHNGEAVHPAMRHKTIYTAKGIRELGCKYGLEYLENKGAGYYPLNFLAKIDSTHSAFFAIAFRKQ